MSIVELRKEVINSLENADERFLRMVCALYKSYAKKKITNFNELPNDIQELILQSRESIKNGNFFSHDMVMKEAKKKYKITE